MSTLMHLPPEVRVMIFRYCFTIGKIFPYLKQQLEEEEELQAYDTFLDTTAHPPSLATIEERRRYPAQCLAIVQVNKPIRDEANSVLSHLFRANTVVLPNAPWSAKFFQHCLKSADQRLWLRDVELELCAADLPYSIFSSTAHNTSKQHLAKITWPQKLAPILEDTNLDRLTVKFENSKCPVGCCPYMDWSACAAFQRGFARGMVPHISLHNISLYDFDHFYDPDPEAYKRDDQEVSGTKRPIVSDQNGEEDLGRDTMQAAEQIARWTRARELGVHDGTRMWFQAAKPEDEEDEEDEEESEESGESEEEWVPEKEEEEEEEKQEEEDWFI